MARDVAGGMAHRLCLIESRDSGWVSAMADYQKIEYRIGKDGKVTETVLNGRGESCALVTEGLERSLGEVESRDLLPEYYDGTENGVGVDAIAEQSQTLQQG